MTKTKFFSAALLAAGLAACSHGPSNKTGAVGPVVLNPKAEPNKIELNAYLQAKEPHQILADVQDINGKVTDVRLQFAQPNVSVPMEKVGGTMWRTEIPSELLKRMGVSGETMSYQAKVIARDDRGQVGVSEDTIQIQVKAPEFELTG